ncbi:hypothetical protein H012_gp287 [Acanthamoeba polyphaga moumouvirus]|uniref:DUF2784 domain-containing protein n=2 Tax=Moumouvirus TaxID=3080801 RepID=L7RCW7_9VIRU|nr:hypothetical protein H012_gp287 [Acanthamoeba polyphaga moumouvirus]AEX62507.1 hypothetical protein mv_R302 [Moumouvirus Monve]AGC02167.1 hypothetical protein Moumou_00643 [Acanthamoeba polyphaga moumouvirus]
MNNLLLLIKALHLIIVILVLISVFIPNCMLKKLVLTLLIFLLIQYIFGINKCGLTQLEYLLMGEKYREGFIYRIINPIICVPENYFNNGLLIVHIFWIIILGYQIYSQCL